MRIDRKWLVIGLLSGLLFSAVAYAKTVSQIWNLVYDSSNTALRVNQVAGS